MTLTDFKATLTQDEPPAGLAAPLLALWHDAKGDWEGAHRSRRTSSRPDGAWIHAYLHRKEGDAVERRLLVSAGGQAGRARHARPRVGRDCQALLRHDDSNAGPEAATRSGAVQPRPPAEPGSVDNKTPTAGGGGPPAAGVVQPGHSRLKLAIRIVAAPCCGISGLDEARCRLAARRIGDPRRQHHAFVQRVADRLRC